MKIQLIPETPEEQATLTQSEHTGVREFLMFGYKTDRDGQAVEIHDWTGTYLYLIGHMGYYKTVLEDERRAKEGPAVPKAPPETNRFPKLMPNIQELEAVEQEKGASDEPTPEPTPDAVIQLTTDQLKKQATEITGGKKSSKNKDDKDSE